jgi:hypothetical protein
MHRKLLASACLGLAATAALAEPAVVYDMGGKFDKSFNQAAYDGAERWKKETGKPYLEFEITNPTQREQAKRRMAERGIAMAAHPVVTAMDPLLEFQSEDGSEGYRAIMTTEESRLNINMLLNDQNAPRLEQIFQNFRMQPGAAQGLVGALVALAVQAAHEAELEKLGQARAHTKHLPAHRVRQLAGGRGPMPAEGIQHGETVAGDLGLQVLKGGVAVVDGLHDNFQFSVSNSQFSVPPKVFSAPRWAGRSSRLRVWKWPALVWSW